MDNINDLNLYLVSEGEVSSANTETEWDGTNNILVAAVSEEGALKIAQMYDDERVGVDNMDWEGETIAVVSYRDRNTGQYL